MRALDRVVALDLTDLISGFMTKMIEVGEPVFLL